MRKAILNRGVSVVVLPGDVALRMAPEDATLTAYPGAAAGAAADERAEQAGGNAEQGEEHHPDVRQAAPARTMRWSLAELLQAPVVHALRGKEHIEWDNPYSVGMTGLIGFSSGYHAMMNADTLVLLGTQFPYRAFYPTNANIIQIDINPGSIGAHCPVNMALVGDIHTTLTALLPQLEPKRDRAFLDKALEHYRNARKDLDGLATANDDQPIHPQYLAQQLSQYASDDAIHLRRRHADGVGRSLRENERQASPARFVQPRFDGQRHAAGDRRPCHRTG